MDANTKFCQSCAMPLEDEKLIATEADGSKNEDYCIYCYENGRFTGEVTMQEMIDLSVPPMVASGQFTEAEARAMMEEAMPKLKRWKN